MNNFTFTFDLDISDSKQGIMTRIDTFPPHLLKLIEEVPQLNTVEFDLV